MPAEEIISFQTYKHRYLIRTWSEKGFKGTVVNWAMSSLHGGSLEISLTIPLTKLKENLEPNPQGLDCKT